MKKLTALFIALALVLGLCACSATATWQEQYDLGVRYLTEGKYEEAIIAFQAAIDIDPRRADAYLGLSEAYEATGDAARARQVLEDALSVVSDPDEIQDRLDGLGGGEPEPTAVVTVEPMLADISDIYAGLIEQYGNASSERFVSSMGPSDTSSFPYAIFGVISGETADLDQDGTNELLVLRSVDGDEAVRLGADYNWSYVVAEVYQLINNQAVLTASQFVSELVYCQGSNIYLFYSDTLEQYCIICDYGTWGNFTGLNSAGAVCYTVTVDAINQYGSWVSMNPLNLLDVDDVEMELLSIGAPYAEHSATIDNRSNVPYFKMLCQVLHDGFDISEEDAIIYDNGWNLGHSLQIIGGEN